MDGRIALVTGANRGIGLEVVRQLARRGFVAVLGARDADRGAAAARGLRHEGLEVEIRAPRSEIGAETGGIRRLSSRIGRIAGRRLI
jgi:NAD(P)-dependent dehydrogenase (short-subunit alcohol dehydrogenase family)